MKTKFFSQCIDEHSLLKLALQLKDILQLDKPDNSILRSEVEAEYHYLLNSFKKSANSHETEKKELTQDEILEKIKPLNLEIEICGKWLWVYGNTRPVKDTLKQLKLRFNPGKKCWYWRPDKFRSINKDPLEMDEIRRLYGSRKIVLANN